MEKIRWLLIVIFCAGGSFFLSGLLGDLGLVDFERGFLPTRLELWGIGIMVFVIGVRTLISSPK